MDISSRIIVLTGLMGAGKTRVGSELSQLLRMPFVDADKEIVAAAGMSIPDIFDVLGEPAFRAGEKKVMSRLLSGEGKVIATGGGAFIQDEVRKLVKEKAISIWLKADLDVLVGRITHTEHRPALQGGNIEEKLRVMMDDRTPIYEEADITVVTNNQTPQDMAERIRLELEKRIRKEG